MSGILQRIQRIERRVRPEPAAVDEFTALIESLTQDELDHIITNLLIAGGPPADPATLAIWERALVAGGISTLTAAEYDALSDWIMAGGDAPAVHE